MMTIMLARDSTNDRANEAKGDVIITDVIMAHRLFLGHFMIIMIIKVVTVMAMIGAVALKEIVEQCTIHTFFKYVIKKLWTCKILEDGL